MKHPTCDFSLKGEQEVSGLISERLNAADPFSLIRLGDGEGLLLSISDQSPEADFNYLVKHFGPYGVILDNLLHLKDRLIESIKDADMIGVRDDIVDVTFAPSSFSLHQNEFLENFRKSFRLREVDKLLDYHGSRRVALLHKTLSKLDFPGNSRFCSAWFHYSYHISGDIFKALGQQERIGVVSCRTRISTLIEELFGISVKFIEIPNMFRNLSADKTIPDYIEQLEKVLKRQLVEFPGMLFLVGGGLYGKLYCQLIKSQGGVALDMGSLFDAWLGIPSRPAVYKSMFETAGSKTGVPARLILSAENIDYLL